MPRFFPKTNGQIDLSKYPGMQYLNVTLPGSNRPTTCVVLPVNEDYMRVWSGATKNAQGEEVQIVHPTINFSLEDASNLNEWARNKAQSENKSHTNFHAQVHLEPYSAAYKRMKAAYASRIQSLKQTDSLAYEQMRKKYRLDEDSLNRREQKSRIKEEDIPELIASRIISGITACGRAYAPSLDEPAAPVPQASAGAAVQATAPTSFPTGFSAQGNPQIQGGNPAPFGFPQDAQGGAEAPVYAPPLADGLPF